MRSLRAISDSRTAILDFNSLLPRMVLDDGTPYVDRLAGPFFDYILDHPLFHYQGLSSGVKNLHAIVLDEAQQKYVEKYYEKVGERPHAAARGDKSSLRGHKRAGVPDFISGNV